MPRGKTFSTFDFAAVPTIRKAHVMALADGDAWLDQGANILCFGPSGTGKSHAAAAIGHVLVEGVAGYLSSTVVVAPASRHAIAMFDPDDIILQADIHILDIQPVISRRLELPGDLNLAQLDEVIQASFEWTDSHLHQFDIGGLTYGAPAFDEGDWSNRRTFEASDVRLCDFAAYGPAPLIIFYKYDFGDSWVHVIELTRKPKQPGVKYPRCITGSRRAPPEDVGGPPGYFDFLQAWHDTRHEEHKDMRRWAGRSFHPERFDLDANNKAIAKAIKRSKGSYRFRFET